MSKQKACLNDKRIYEGNKRPVCGENTFTESFKGRIYVFNSTDSEVSKNMKITEKGQFAIKTK